MSRLNNCLALALIAGSAGLASAVPSLTALGSGTPLSVTNNLAGTYYIGGAGSSAIRWTLTGSSLVLTDNGGAGSGYLSLDGQFQAGSFANTSPSIVGNTAASVSPPFNPNPTLVAAVNQPATTEFAARRWSASSNTWQSLGGLPIVPSLIAYGSGSSGGSTGSFLSANGISGTGQYIVGLGYVCTYNSAGTAVSANTFRWRPWIWDAAGNGGAGAMTILPTPFKTTAGQTNLRRTGNAYKVSADGMVIAGATEHNTSVLPGPDVDGGRLVVWRWDSGTSAYVMSYLDTGVDGSGFPNYQSSTPSSMTMNSAGTIIAARGPNGITKWVWNGSSWGAPIVIGANLTTPASWLPFAVTSCGVPPTLGGIIAMSEDGNTIAGDAVYSTCSGFMSGGFIWQASNPTVIQDWYDYNVSIGTPGCSTGGVFGPIGDNGDPSKGLPVLGFVDSISPDASAMVGFQGGTSRIPGAPTWIWQASGGSCVAPTVTTNPTATNNITACVTSVILNAGSSGTPPFSYQWYKNGNPVNDGPTGNGSSVTGATTFQCRINGPLNPADAGSYTCVITNGCGSATTAAGVVQIDPSLVAITNDTCSTATLVTAGTNVLGTAPSICGAWINDTATSSCESGGFKNDRWYKFVPTTTGNYRFDTCGSNFDTVLSLFDGCGGNEIQCNNDYNTGSSTGCSAQRSRISSVALNANQTYYIQISAPAAAFISSTSTLNLSISAAPTLPTNEDCYTAMTIGTGITPFNTTEATPMAGYPVLPCASTAHQSRDLWYTYTAATAGKLTASTCPQGTASGGYSLLSNTVLSIHDSACGNVIACNDNTTTACGANLSVISNLALYSGQQVWIRVSGNSSTAFGQGQLSLSFICAADFNSDGVVDFFDYLDFVDAFSSNNAIADFNHDASIDFFDYLDFVDAFSHGC